jgi:hypothetical protein
VNPHTKLEAVDCLDRIRWWIELRDRGPTQRNVRAILFILSTWMDADGSNCYPTQRSIADAALLSEKATQRLLKQAEQLLWIRVAKERTRGRGWRRCRYVPTLPVKVVTQQERPPAVEGTLDTTSPRWTT